MDSWWPLPVAYRCSVCNRASLNDSRCRLRGGRTGHGGLICSGHGVLIPTFRCHCACTRWLCGEEGLWKRCRACHKQVVPYYLYELEAILKSIPHP